MQVAVILQHSGVQHVRYAHAVELVKLSGRRVECLGDFNGAVAAEIEKDHAVAVLHGADRLAVLCDDKGGQILVDDVQLVPVCFDRLCGGGELPSLAQHVCAPALGDHCPVGFVAVHGDAHPSAAGGDADIEIGAAQLRHEGFKGIDILQRGGLADVTSVDQDMDAHAADALLLGLHNHCLEVVDVGVDIAVRKKPQEMQGGVPILYVGDQRAPRVGGKHFAGLDGLADQLGALRKNLTGTEGVVPDLGVPHVVIRRQTDGCSVCLEFNHGIGRHQTVQRGRVRLCDGVAGGVRRQSDAVHDQCQDRAPDALKIGKMFQLFHTEEFLSFRRHQPRGIALPLYYTHFCRKKQEVSGNFA